MHDYSAIIGGKLATTKADIRTARNMYKVNLYSISIKLSKFQPIMIIFDTLRIICSSQYNQMCLPLLNVFVKRFLAVSLYSPQLWK